MRRIPLLFLALALAAGCGKKDGDKAEPSAKTGEGTAKGTGAGTGTGTATADTGDPIAATGVEPGGIERDADEGAAAVVTAMSGTVEVRRVGTTEFQAIKPEDELFAGDMVRTSDDSTATITMADESVVELTEVTYLGIATREGEADPASGAAVVAGVARFTVIPRVPGEGAFKVYTPAGVIATKGTTYAVGVAADGSARVGVEAGSVEVVGLAQLDTAPVVIEADAAATLAVEGTVAEPAPWPEDDWGTWRDEADAQVTADAAFDAHTGAMATLQADLTDAYASLDVGAEEVAEFETTASASAEANDAAAYEASLPNGTLAIDGTFMVAGTIEAFTWAYASRAELASALYVRHPDTLEAKWTVASPRVEAAVLWPKRFDVTASALLQPMRTQYYVHHPRGRAHAELVGVAVPDFYLGVEPPEVDEAAVAAKVKVKVKKPTVVVVKPSPRPVWVHAPAMDWKVKVKTKPAKFRGKAKFYVRPAAPKAKVFVGVAPRAKFVTKLVVKPAVPRAQVRAGYKVAVGQKIKVRAPDLQVAARARAKVKIKDGVIVRDHRKGADDVKVKVKGDADVVIKGAGDVKVKVKGGADDAKVKVRDHRDDVKGKGDVDVKGKVKVKTPEPPKVDAKVKVKGGVKIGK